MMSKKTLSYSEKLCLSIANNFQLSTRQSQITDHNAKEMMCTCTSLITSDRIECIGEILRYLILTEKKELDYEFEIFLYGLINSYEKDKNNDPSSLYFYQQEEIFFKGFSNIQATTVYDALSYILKKYSLNNKNSNKLLSFWRQQKTRQE